MDLNSMSILSNSMELGEMSRSAETFGPSVVHTTPTMHQGLRELLFGSFLKVKYTCDTLAGKQTCLNTSERSNNGNQSYTF